MDDLYYRELDTLTMLEEVTLFRRKEMNRYQIEAHITWSGFTAGFEMFVGNIGENLNILEMTLLDNFSWTSIVNIGKLMTYFRDLNPCLRHYLPTAN